MSVLIKGMEMPKDCRVCPFEMYYINSGKTRCGAAMRTLAENFKTIPFVGRADFCPLIELPLHGDLIDRDALMKHKGNCYDADGHLLYAVGTGSIMCAPTIIPSEEGE